MKRKAKIGMIGVGFIGQLAHLMNYLENEDCEVVAIADFRSELRRKVATRYDIPRSYATHHELLADNEVEAVCVVTARPYTAPTVLDCLKAGKHVISEKPMAGNFDQASRLVQTAQENNVNYVVGFMKRYDEGVQKAKEIFDKALASSEMGKLIYARSHCFAGDSYCNPWGHIVTDEKTVYPDSGWDMSPKWLPECWKDKFQVYLNTYSHNINILRYFFGKSPRIVSSNVSRVNGQIVVLDWGDCLGVIETGMASNRGWDEVTEFFFTDGRITIKTPPALLRNTPAKIEIYRAGKTQELQVPQTNWTWSFQLQANAFVDCLINGEESISTGKDSIEDMRVIEEIWRQDPTINQTATSGE